MILKKGSYGEDVAKVREKLGMAAGMQFDVPMQAAVAQYQRDHHLTVDGIVGPQVLASMGLPLTLTPLSATARVERAKRLLESKFLIHYRNGVGGTDPNDEDPSADFSVRDQDGTVTTLRGLDCSGCAAYLMGLPRHHDYGSHRWIETTQVYDDATHGQALFRKIAAPKPGCFAVYGDHDGHQGHIGMVLEVGKSIVGVDCSSSRDGISRRDFGFFTRTPGAIWVELVTD